MNGVRIGQLLLALLLVSKLAQAQSAPPKPADFGLKLGTNLYQPQSSLPQAFPRPGAEIGAMARFYVGKQNRGLLQPEFGYILSAVPIDSVPGQPLTTPRSQAFVSPSQVLRHHLHHHFIALQLYGGYGSDRYSVFIGPEVYFTVAQSRVMRYEATPGVSSTSEVIQERSGSDLIEGFPRQLFNLRYGAEMRFFQAGAVDVWGGISIVHQLDVQPYRPTGAALTLKAFLGGLFRKGRRDT